MNTSQETTSLGIKAIKMFGDESKIHYNEIRTEEGRYWSIGTISDYFGIDYHSVYWHVQNKDHLKKYILKPFKDSQNGLLRDDKGQSQDSIFLKIPESLVLLCFYVKKLRKMEIIDKILELYGQIADGEVKVAKKKDIEDMKKTTEQNRQKFNRIKSKQETSNIRLTDEIYKNIALLTQVSEETLKNMKIEEFSRKLESHIEELQTENKTLKLSKERLHNQKERLQKDLDKKEEVNDNLRKFIKRKIKVKNNE